MLPADTKNSLIRNLQSRFLEQTTRLVERFALIVNFPSFLVLDEAVSPSARVTYIQLVENAKDLKVSKWLDSQVWILDKWEEKDLNDLKSAIENNLIEYDYPNLIKHASLAVS